jgi:hypothetical protein
MKLLEKLWELITGIVPIERWIRAIGNVLKWLSLAFILLFGLIALLITKDWGFTSDQRMNLIHWILIIMIGVLIFGIILALMPGGILYSPYEQSLRRGKNYGNQSKPISKGTAKTLPDQIPVPKLPKGGKERKRQLP